MLTATIFDIERNSFVDGPGIRTTVFFKGCNLRCAWCHNPESQMREKEIFCYPDKCTGCGRCNGLTVEDSDFFCFNDAKELCGREYTVDEVLSEVVKDIPYYESSGGGVTLSGGECMLQLDFVTELMKCCKKKGIHTAVDTAGHIPFESFEKIMPYTDLVLYDVKTVSSKKHLEYTGVGNELILENLKRLLVSNLPVWVRMPIVSGINDSEEEMKGLSDFFKAYGYPEKTELLPYHAMGEHKYRALGRKSQQFNAPDGKKLQMLKDMIKR